MKYSILVTNLGCLLAALSVAPPCRAQEGLSSVTLTVPSADSKQPQQPADSVLASAQTRIVTTLRGAATPAWLLLPGLDLFGPTTSSERTQMVGQADVEERHRFFSAAVQPGAARLKTTFCPQFHVTEAHNCYTAGSNASRQPSATSERLPADVDPIQGSTWKQLYTDVVADQKTVLRYPVHLARGHHWKPSMAVAAGIAGLIALDPHDSPYFRRAGSFHGFNTAASGVNTGIAMALVPAAFYVASVKRSDSYGKQTIFLAAEAVADAQIITVTMKMIDRRIRPIDVPGQAYADTWFKARVFGGKSFPSGHTITAFALADVFTERYKGHRWVPWVAYGLASAVGFSRLTLQAHFPSDVLAGAVLGVVIPHDLVLRH